MCSPHVHRIYGLVIAYISLVCWCMCVISFAVFLTNKELFTQLVGSKHSNNGAVRGVIALFLVLSLGLLFISSLLIRGITMKCYRLMIPGLLTFVTFIVCTLSITLVMWLQHGSRSMHFLNGIIVLGSECVIFYPMFTLYQDIRTEAKILSNSYRAVYEMM